LDLGLPAMHGLQAAQWIRSQPRFDPMSLVMVSASEQSEHVKAASRLGAQCYLAKYPQPSVLRKVIAEATEFESHHGANRWFGIQENLILRWATTSGFERQP
jgi:DNA-binding NarL/FixJ family response regulator